MPQVAGLYSTYKTNNGRVFRAAPQLCCCCCMCSACCAVEQHSIASTAAPEPASKLLLDAGSAPLVSSAAGPGADPAMVAAAGMDPSSGNTSSGLSCGEIAGIVLAALGGAMALATVLAMAVVGYRKRRQG